MGTIFCSIAYFRGRKITLNVMPILFDKTKNICLQSYDIFFPTFFIFILFANDVILYIRDNRNATRKLQKKMVVCKINSKVGLKVFLLSFSLSEIFSRIAGLWWWHISLAVVDCVFVLESRPLDFGFLYI